MRSECLRRDRNVSHQPLDRKRRPLEGVREHQVVKKGGVFLLIRSKSRMTRQSNVSETTTQRGEKIDFFAFSSRLDALRAVLWCSLSRLGEPSKSCIRRSRARLRLPRLRCRCLQGALCSKTSLTKNSVEGFFAPKPLDRQASLDCLSERHGHGNVHSSPTRQAGKRVS